MLLQPLSHLIYDQLITQSLSPLFFWHCWTSNVKVILTIWVYLFVPFHLSLIKAYYPCGQIQVKVLKTLCLHGLSLSQTILLFRWRSEYPCLHGNTATTTVPAWFIPSEREEGVWRGSSRASRLEAFLLRGAASLWGGALREEARRWLKSLGHRGSSSRFPTDTVTTVKNSIPPAFNQSSEGAGLKGPRWSRSHSRGPRLTYAHPAISLTCAQRPAILFELLLFFSCFFSSFSVIKSHRDDTSHLFHPCFVPRFHWTLERKWQEENEMWLPLRPKKKKVKKKIFRSGNSSTSCKVKC